LPRFERLWLPADGTPIACCIVPGFGLESQRLYRKRWQKIPPVWRSIYLRPLGIDNSGQAILDRTSWMSIISSCSSTALLSQNVSSASALYLRLPDKAKVEDSEHVRFNAIASARVNVGQRAFRCGSLPFCQFWTRCNQLWNPELSKTGWVLGKRHMKPGLSTQAITSHTPEQAPSRAWSPVRA
jgi:hypothetical protein